MKESKKEKKKKKTYTQPKLRKEKVMAFGALCNGSATGGRKSTAGSPDFCQANKLLS
ncbi:MAG: hypothetical protein KDD33_00130 [Bdellovibrionales bacterium]|nr:hypothetical protein [Bdellovibrionales bacterium]